MSQSSWQELNISPAELEQVFESNLISSWALALASGLILRQPQAWQAIVKLESLCLFLSLIFNFPLVLIMGRNWGLVNNIQGLVVSWAIALSLSALCLILVNYYLWQKAKQLKLLSSLLLKVKQHNQLVNSFRFLTEINHVRQGRAASQIQSVTEFKTALNLTKNSLLNSIELENYLYSQRHIGSNNTFPYNPAQLLADLEANLASIMSPEIDRDLEYQQLLHEAINLGLSLHQEIQKCWTLRQPD